MSLCTFVTSTERSKADEKGGVKSLVGTEHWPAFRLQVYSAMSCEAPSSSGKARPSSIAETRWASHAEGGNVGQAPKERISGPKGKKRERSGGWEFCCDLIMELKAMVEYWFDPSGSTCSRCTKRMPMS